MILIFGLGLSHCAAPKHSQAFKKSKALSARYSSNPMIVGKASWYGRGFHGKRTASGEKFNMYDLTAAHRTLPFGTMLEITYLKTNQKVDVRVNDRGPFIRGRVVDISYQAAKSLGLLADGHGEVEVRVLN